MVAQEHVVRWSSPRDSPEGIPQHVAGDVLGRTRIRFPCRGRSTPCVGAETPLASKIRDTKDGRTPRLRLRDGGQASLDFKLVSAAWAHREMDLVFSHFHMDHVFAVSLSSCRIYTPGFDDPRSPSRRTVLKKRPARSSAGTSTACTIPPGSESCPANVSFSPYSLRVGSFQTGALRGVRRCQLNHPGRRRSGYRVQCKGDASVAYLTDTAPFASPG